VSGTCGRRYRNPITHTCTVKTDFKQRVTAQARAAATAEKRKKAAAVRAKEVAARRARRAREDAARKTRRQREDEARKARRAKAAKPAAARSRPTHPRPSACRDADCERPVCLAYRDGFEDGAHSAGESG
jgi:hypothetical protein